MNPTPICVRVGIDGLNEQGWVLGSSHLSEHEIHIDERVLSGMDNVLRHKDTHAYEHLYLITSNAMETSFAHVVMSSKFALLSRHPSYPRLSSFVSWNHYRGSLGQNNLHDISVVSNDLDILLMQLLKSSELTAPLRAQLQERLQHCLLQAQAIVGQAATGYVNDQLQEELVVFVANQAEQSQVLNALLANEIYKDYRAIYISSNKELCSYLNERNMEVENATAFFKRVRLVRKYHETIATLRQFQEGMIDERDYYQRFQPQFENSLLNKLEMRMQQELHHKEDQVQELSRENVQLQQRVAELENKLRRLQPSVAPQVTYSEATGNAPQRFQPQGLQDKQYQAATRVAGLQHANTNSSRGVEDLSQQRQQREAELAAQRQQQQRQQQQQAAAASKANSTNSKKSAPAAQQTKATHRASK